MGKGPAVPDSPPTRATATATATHPVQPHHSRVVPLPPLIVGVALPGRQAVPRAHHQQVAALVLLRERGAAEGRESGNSAGEEAHSGKRVEWE